MTLLHLEEWLAQSQRRALSSSHDVPLTLTCRSRPDLFANYAVLQPKKQFVHMESTRKQNLPPSSAGFMPGWPLEGPFSRSPEARKVAPWVQACLRPFTFLTSDMSSTETLSRRHAPALYSDVLRQWKCQTLSLAFTL